MFPKAFLDSKVAQGRVSFTAPGTGKTAAQHASLPTSAAPARTSWPPVYRPQQSPSPTPNVQPRKGFNHVTTGLAVCQPKITPAPPAIRALETAHAQAKLSAHQQLITTRPRLAHETRPASPIVPLILQRHLQIIQASRKSKKSKKNNEELSRADFLRQYSKKPVLPNWQLAGQHYKKYVERDQLEWLDIARALGCDLPKKVGHGRGGHDDEQSHAQTYFKYYVIYVVKKKANDDYGTTEKRGLKRRLNIA